MDYKKYLWLILIPFIVVVAAFSYNAFLGIAVVVCFLTFVLWQQRPNLLTQRAQREYAKGNNTKALEIFKKAHRTNRNSPANNILYAYILLRCGQDDEAAKVLNMVLFSSRLKPAQRMQAKQNLSLVRYRQGDMEEALRLMEEVFESYKSTGVYGALGYYKIVMNAPDAMEFALEAYDYNSDDKIIIDNLVQMYILRGQYEKAKVLSDKTLAAGNDGVEVYFHAGQIELAKGNRQQAAELFAKAQQSPRSFMTTVPEAEIARHLEMAGTDRN